MGGGALVAAVAEAAGVGRPTFRASAKPNLRGQRPRLQPRPPAPKPRRLLASRQTLSSAAGPPSLVQRTKRDQTLRLLVPQREVHATQALDKRQAADLGEFGKVAQHLAQPVEGNAARQMMDVVHADIGGEPAQHDRQIVVGSSRAAPPAAGSSSLRAPSASPRIGAGRRTARRRSSPRARRSGPWIIRKAPGPISHISSADDERDRGVGGHRRDPGPPAGAAHEPDRQRGAAAGRDRSGRSQTAPADCDTAGRRGAGASPTPDIRRTVSVSMSPMPRRSRLPVAGVMRGVRTLPVVIGRQRQDAERAADPIVHRAGAKEGAVPAIVLDHEQPHQKPGRRQTPAQG